ncbi:MAG: N-acetylmuramoyl-L-alanine amidase [Oscillospiraceae bacterium]|nr:N-acetylmuramoyl-L-alanine amidase [Oscillospiraceae bacterium]
MAKRRRIRWDRVAIVFIPLFLLIVLICVQCGKKDEGQELSIISSSETTAVTTVNTFTDLLFGSTTTVTTTTTYIETMPKEIVIVIDPGHGGNDSGATNEDATRLEKDDNLTLGLAVRDAFMEYDNVRVVMTRDKDEFVDLKDRCRIANSANADFFLSIHRNSSQTGNGIEIWVNNNSGGDNTWDKLLAEYVLDWLDQAGISLKRGVKQGFRNSGNSTSGDNYYVNLYTEMPSCLIEMGFMTSDVDNKLFDEKLHEYAAAIAGGTIELMTDKAMYPIENGTTPTLATETVSAETVTTVQ